MAMTTAGGGDGGGCCAFALQVLRGRWFMMFASFLIMAGAGATYLFGVYSKDIKSTLGYDQSTLNLLSSCKDLGANVGVLSGLIAEVAPTWLVLLVGTESRKRSLAPISLKKKNHWDQPMACIVLEPLNSRNPTLGASQIVNYRPRPLSSPPLQRCRWPDVTRGPRRDITTSHATKKQTRHLPFPRTRSVLRGLESLNHHSRTSFSCSFQKQEKFSANHWFSPSSSSKDFRAVDMGNKSLVVTGMSAEKLHKVSIIRKMNPYVVVSVSGNHKQQTHVHKKGGTRPRWDSLLTFPIEEAYTDLLNLVFEIMTGKKEVGRVTVGIAKLLQEQGDGTPKEMSCSVTLPSGKTQGGDLKFTYKFVEELPGGCGNTPAPEQGPTQKARGQALLGVAGKGAVWAATAVVEGVAGEFAGDLINGSEVTEDK